MRRRRWEERHERRVREEQGGRGERWERNERRVGVREERARNEEGIER